MTEGIRDKSYRRDWRRAEVSRAPELILVVLRCNPLAGASGFRPGFRRASEDLLRRFQGDPRTHLKGILRAPKLIPEMLKKLFAAKGVRVSAPMIRGSELAT